MNEPILEWSDVAERLKALGKGAPYRLSVALGMNSSQLYRHLKGRGRISARHAAAVAAWLAQHDLEEPAPAPPAAADRPRWPVYGRPVDEEGERFALDAGAELELREPPAWLAIDAGDVILARVPGSMMEPRLRAGELVVALRRAPPARDQDVLVEFTDGTAAIKTFRARRQGRVWVADFADGPREASYEAGGVRALHAVIARL